MSWNPEEEQMMFLRSLGQYKQSQLGGGGVTLGNQQAQTDYAAQMARALLEAQQAQSQSEQGASMMAPEYAQNSGFLGSLAMGAQAFAGKRMRDKSDRKALEAGERYGKAKGAADLADEERKAEREQQSFLRKLEVARSGDPAMAAAMGMTIPERKAPTLVDVPDGRGGTIKMENTPDGLRRIRVASDAQNTPAANAGFKVFRDVIAGIESAGSGDYKAIGPQTKTGDRAYGRYQVMGANIPEWTKAALGRAMSPEEFAASPEAQDAVFDHRFGGYVQKYGPEGAAKAWFAGEGGMNNPGARDVLGTSVEEYGRKFSQGMGGTQEAYGDSASGVIGGGLGYTPPKKDDDKPAEWQAKIEYLVKQGVPQQQAIQAVLGGKSQRITVNPDTGEISIEDGMPGGLTNASTTRTQADIQGAQDALAGLDRVGQAVKDSYLTYGGLAKGAAGRQMDRAGMTNDLTKFNAERGGALMEVEQFFNQYRKLITGAAAAEKELAALREATINGKLGPQEFQSRYDRLVSGLRADVERKQGQLGGGKPERKQYTQGEVASLLQEARAAVAQGAPKEAVAKRLRDKGLHNIAGRL